MSGGLIHDGQKDKIRSTAADPPILCTPYTLQSTHSIWHKEEIIIIVAPYNPESPYSIINSILNRSLVLVGIHSSGAVDQGLKLFAALGGSASGPPTTPGD